MIALSQLLRALPNPTVVVTSPALTSPRLADEIAAVIDVAGRERRSAVISIATGKTPEGLYEEMAKRVRSGRLVLNDSLFFPLDEFVGVPPEHPASLYAFLRERLIVRTGAPECVLQQMNRHTAYEAAIAAAGGIDLVVLGIGRNGHVAFNEPGSPRDSVTREVDLAPTTREDAAKSFGGIAHVPTRGITMGIATLLAARRVRLLAFGATKREVVRRLLDGPVDAGLPASFLREHRDFTIYLDAAAAGEA